MTGRWIVALWGLAGCATSAAPYRFQSPLISGASARIEPFAAPDRPAVRVATAARHPNPAPAPARPRVDDPMPREELTATPTPSPVATASGLVLSRLLHPHRADGAIAVELPARATVADLRALTGTRVTDDPLAFALATARNLEATAAGPDPLPADGAALAAWAGAHASVIEPPSARPGDLLAFDRAIAGKPASVWAVVLGRDDRGVVEMVYVAGGVVRRGFLDPALPHVARDKQGQVHNSYLRHGKDWPPKGTRYLTGELLAAVYRLAHEPLR